MLHLLHISVFGKYVGMRTSAFSRCCQLSATIWRKILLAFCLPVQIEQISTDFTVDSFMQTVSSVKIFLWKLKAAHLADFIFGSSVSGTDSENNLNAEHHK